MAGSPSAGMPGAGAPGGAGTPPRLTRRARRRNRLVAVGGLTLVWILLWGTFSWANLIGGAVVAVAVLTAFPLPPVTYAGRVDPIALLRFLARFVYELVVASVQIAWLAVRIGYTPRSAIIGVRLRVNTDLNLTLTAEALSLVPGSLILEVDRAAGVLYVHVLGVHTREEVERFRGEVLATEKRLIDAIGSQDERRLVAEASKAHHPPIDPRGPYA